MLGAVAGAVACEEKQPLEPDQSTSARPANTQLTNLTTEGDVLASAIAGAMRSPKVRRELRDAMRASLFTEHKLDLQEFALTAAGKRLITEAARVSGRSSTSLQALIRSLPPAQFYVPANHHRLTWKASDNVMVAAMLTSTRPNVAYHPSGSKINLDFTKQPEAYPALVLIQYAEAKDRRVSPQPNVPGLTIQDPGDGQIGGLEQVRGADGQIRMVQLADIAKLDGSGRLVRTNQTCNPDINAGCGGGGGGGGGGTARPAIYLTHFETHDVEDGTPWESNEFEWRATWKAGWDETITHRLPTWPRKEGIPKSAIINYTNFMVNDWAPDDLGSKVSIPVLETDVAGSTNNDLYLWADDPPRSYGTGANVVVSFSRNGFQFKCWRDNYENNFPTSNTTYSTFVF